MEYQSTDLDQNDGFLHFCSYWISEKISNFPNDFEVNLSFETDVLK